MANEGHIFIKRPETEKPKQTSGRWGVKQFFRPVDKGSNKPAFCYPRRAEGLAEEYEQRKRTLDSGAMDGTENKMQYEMRTKQIGERVDLIKESFDGAREIIDKAPDAWRTRMNTLAKEIKERMPSRDDVIRRRVNPHTNLKNEKVGMGEDRPLEQVKKEYTVIARAFQARGDEAEANSSFLQKDK
jgi:hypothetical protein